MSFRLADAVPWGRSFDEYVAMFDLTDMELGQRVLGCADGPASFNAELTRTGGRIVSVDPVFRFGAEEIRARIDETTPLIAAELASNADRYVWARFRSVDEVVQTRLAAMETFLADYESGLAHGRYVDAALPNMPFENGDFDLALCSHFLFLYTEQYDLAFHIRSLQELSRVAAEVRIFPIVDLNTQVSRHLEASMRTLEDDGLRVVMTRVEYEFQKGADEMLVLTRS